MINIRTTKNFQYYSLRAHLVWPELCCIAVERAGVVGLTQQGLDGQQNGPDLHGSKNTNPFC
jgi:hypothetical protein